MGGGKIADIICEQQSTQNFDNFICLTDSVVALKVIKLGLFVVFNQSFYIHRRSNLLWPARGWAFQLGGRHFMHPINFIWNFIEAWREDGESPLAMTLMGELNSRVCSCDCIFPLLISSRTMPTVCTNCLGLWNKAIWREERDERWENTGWILS